MAKNKNLLLILIYLLSLDDNTRVWVIEQMIVKQNGGVHTDGGGGCSGIPPSPPPTPYGDWVCRDGNWVWVPDLG